MTRGYCPKGALLNSGCHSWLRIRVRLGTMKKLAVALILIGLGLFVYGVLESAGVQWKWNSDNRARLAVALGAIVVIGEIGAIIVGQIRVTKLNAALILTGVGLLFYGVLEFGLTATVGAVLAVGGWLLYRIMAGEGSHNPT